MSLVFLIRHGDYDYRDTAPETHGQGLTETGTKQADATADWFEGVAHKVDLILSSDYRRAAQTAEIIGAKYPAVSHQTSTDLRESIDAYSRDLPQAFQAASTAYKRIFVTPGASAQSTVVVCHANLIRYFLSRLQRWSRQRWEEAVIGNCSVSAVELADGRRPAVQYVASEEHLPPHLREPGWP
jgi:serine/threonine-protein phosphatase PGAM5